MRTTVCTFRIRFDPTVNYFTHAFYPAFIYIYNSFENFSFTRQEFLDSHIKRVHHLIDAHACEICLKVLKSKADYKSHQLSHQNESQQKLRCNICGAHLKNENSMKKHMQRHNDVEHNCTICDRVYFNQLSLNEHMRIMHNGQEQTCTFCAKSFRTTQRLKVS